MALMSFNRIPEGDSSSNDPNCVNLMIRLDPNTDKWYSGGFLRGIVELSALERVLVQDLSVNLIGIAEIAWHDNQIKSERKDLRKLYYNSAPHRDQRHIYFRQKVLLANKEVDPTNQLQEIPFEIFIDEDCISTCSFEFGFVVYKLSATCRTYKGTKVLKQNVQIMQLADCPMERPFLEIRAKRNIQLQTSLQKKFFQPGETVNIQTQILLNSHKTRPHKIIIQLLQYITYMHYCIRYRKNGEPYDSYEYLNQQMILINDDLASTAKLLEQDTSIQHSILLPNDLVPTTHLTSSIIISIHYDIKVILLDDKDEELHSQHIPFDVFLQRHREQHITLREQDSYKKECCKFYNQKRFNFKDGFSRLFK
uniref:Arrestin C-terminal-like domain-containing protein n=1 Tax=Stomoxys calcitrans TaxID=35570 RepID=A0A1I8PCH7_STOCA